MFTCVQVSVIKDRKTLVLYTLHDPDNPVELAFQQRYGLIASYQWFDHSLLCLLLFLLL